MTAGDIYSIGNSTACFSIGAAIDRAGNLISVGPWVAAIAAKSGKFYGRAMTAGHQYLITSTMSANHVGDRAMAARAEIWPQGIALDSRGDLLMVDFEPGDRQQGQIRLVPAGSPRVFGRLVRRGHIYTIAAGLGDGAFARPLQGIAVDRFGNAIVGLNTSIDVLAVRAGRFYGQTMRAGHLYPVAGGGTGGGSGVAAKSVVLRPAGLTTDRDGNIVIADTFGANLVRVVAVRSGTFYGTPMKAGDIYSIAGTGSASGLERDGVPGTESVIDPVGVVTDKAGNIVVTDVNNNTVRVIAARPGKFYGQQMIPGDIYRLAGNGHQGFRGNGSPARAAEFSAPCGLALDADGNVLVADLGNRRIRVVAVRSGTFYGLAMKAGDIYTIAGSGGLPGTPMQPPSAHGTGKFADGIVARNAELLSPAAVTVAASGAVFVADSYRVRVITP